LYSSQALMNDYSINWVGRNFSPSHVAP
jgi:hypothetical protein